MLVLTDTLKTLVKGPNVACQHKLKVQLGVRYALILVQREAQREAQVKFFGKGHVRGSLFRIGVGVFDTRYILPWAMSGLPLPYKALTRHVPSLTSYLSNLPRCFLLHGGPPTHF